MSPGLASSERIRIVSHLGQLTFFTIVANGPRPSSLSLRETPAQKGQSTISHGLTVSGISNALPHSGQLTLLMCHKAKIRWSFPRSNPTITSLSTTITGVARRPIFWTSSSIALGSSATLRSVNGIWWCERNSFAARHAAHPGVE